MIAQKTAPVTSIDSGHVSINRLVFEKLEPLTRSNPHAAPVMFTLLSRIGTDGAVRITLASLATRCHSTLQQVESAIADLAHGGLILAVEASTEPGGLLTCAVSPQLAVAVKPGD